MKIKITNYILAFVCLVSVVSCNEFKHNSTTSEDGNSRPPGNVAHTKTREMRSLVRMVSCAMKYDTMCFLDVADGFLEAKRNELLAQADAEAVRATGRSDNESKPSQLANTLGKLFTEITSLFQNGFSGFFQEAREVDEDSDLDENEDEKTDVSEAEKNGTARSSNGAESGRAKKKKVTKKFKGLKGLVRLLKVATIAVIVFLKIAVLLKAIQTALQFKLMLVAVGGFAIQAVKFWQSLKGHHDHEEISYQNPYLSASPGGLGSVDFQGGYPGAEYGPARSFDGASNSEYAQNGEYAQDREYAQDVAYNTQKPY